MSRQVRYVESQLGEFLAVNSASFSAEVGNGRRNELISIINQLRKTQRIGTGHEFGKGFSKHVIIYFKMVKEQFKIAIPELEDYRVGEDGHLYRLGFTDKRKNERGVRKIIKDEDRRAYKIGRSYYRASLIESKLVEIPEEERTFLVGGEFLR